MISNPGGPAPAVDARTQLLNAFRNGGGGGGVGRDNMTLPGGQTDRGGMFLRPSFPGARVQKAQGNVVNMLHRAVAQHILANAPQMISEHGAGQMVVPHGAAIPLTSEHGAGQMVGPNDANSFVSEHGAGQNTDLPTNDANHFAVNRLHQLVAAGLLGSVPKGGDPAAQWRQLSSKILGDPQNLQRFLQLIGKAQTPNQGTGPYIGTM